VTISLRLLLVSAAPVGARRVRCNLACNTAEPPLRTKYLRHGPKHLSFRHPLRLLYFGRPLKPQTLWPPHGIASHHASQCCVFGPLVRKGDTLSLCYPNLRRSHLQVVPCTDTLTKRGRSALAEANWCRWVIVPHTMIFQDAKSTAYQHALPAQPSHVKRPWLVV